MKNLNKKLAALLVGGTFVGATLVAQAHESEDMTAVTSAAVTLESAVMYAKEAVPGTAAKAEFEDEHGQLVWEIEIVNAKGQVYDVTVDAKSGKIVNKELDKADSDEDEDDKD